ncbi:beta-N-acetylhexosaminidase [Anaerosolibacter carboniphilus]|uniref:Beta-N-acetylhexosaminidase n=1 Tax=Anaerosolibacter carboniphilus TaxID=1417629 RepID=A0A841KL48_9FIRM|nr:glycoside hydrolase family 3 protein [Anaerosolibacter carboniphilus]MBB6214133.1 beta-N-acetylhexosaminidase [Anaerosolibacter carboniphilus]
MGHRNLSLSLFLTLILTFSILSGCSGLWEKSETLPEAPIEENENPPEETDPAQTLLDQMSLEEKIGQMLIVGFQEASPTPQTQQLIQENKVGGFILFKRNYKDFDTAVSLTNQLKSWNSQNPLPLFISVDEEGGTVSRLPDGGTKFPDARLLGQIDDPNLTYQMGQVIGSELKAMGVNLNYAPVLDIVLSKENKLLIRRAFGSTPDIVTRHGLHFIQGQQEAGVIAAPKHFPGHGDTVVDSHGKLPKIMIEKDLLHRRELIPFQAAIEEGVDALMVGHLAFPLIDPSELPATKSALMMKDLLRTELGYGGLIITDDVEMSAYVGKEKDLKESILLSIDGGADLFIAGHTYDTQIKILDIIKTAVQDGRIPEERINESVLRIIRTKSKYQLTNEAIDVEQAKQNFGTGENKQVLEEITSRSKNRK